MIIETKKELDALEELIRSLRKHISDYGDDEIFKKALEKAQERFADKAEKFVEEIKEDLSGEREAVYTIEEIAADILVDSAIEVMGWNTDDKFSETATKEYVLRDEKGNPLKLFVWIDVEHDGCYYARASLRNISKEIQLDEKTDNVETFSKVLYKMLGECGVKLPATAPYGISKALGEENIEKILNLDFKMENCTTIWRDLCRWNRKSKNKSQPDPFGI